MAKTWESMWDGLLSEAARLCAQGHPRSSDIPSRYAASIVLARASFDAYLSEFVEWRGLPQRIKHARFRDALIWIYKELSLPPPSFVDGLWDELALLNDIRNELVHHKAGRFLPGQSPGGLIKRLVTKGVLAAKPSAEGTWEAVVSSESIARWACAVVGRSIAHMECTSHNRRRSLLIVVDRLNQILSILKISIELPIGANNGQDH